jgi:hypothetical protein
MDNVSRPLIALLVGSVAFFAIWMVALKPSSSPPGSGSSGGGSPPYQSAISKAHQAVATSNGASAAHGGVIAGGSAARTPGSTTPVAKAPAPTTPAARTPAAITHGAIKAHARVQLVLPRHVSATPAQRLRMVTRALRANKVLALLFYNEAAADDRAVRRELAGVPTHRSGVVKLAVPLAELAQYTVITSQVPVSSSPTLVLIDRTQHASTIVGFADRFEIVQRVDDALATR